MRIPDKVYEWPLKCGPVVGGFEIFTYQLALGISIRWWSCLNTPALRLYIGPFKLWLYIEGLEEKEGEK